MTTSKKTKGDLGQFYTTNYSYILQNFEVPPEDVKVIEPFAGNCDLLKFLKYRETVKCYDIDPKTPFTTQRDTLKFPPDFNDAFVITNPPFLARNKCKDKEIFDKYGENDLYKCFIKILTDSVCIGGILILPLNFFCSTRLSDKELRRKFLEKYRITKMNIFEERVFDDTSCTVCSFQFCLGKNEGVCATIYPKNEKISFTLGECNNWSIGGEIYDLPNLGFVVRATSDCLPNTQIVMKCIDNNAEDKICLKIVEDPEKYIDITQGFTCRTYAVLRITPEISLEDQHVLVEKFNSFLGENRAKYHSLFLANYRESSRGFARKRMSFGLAYKILNHLLVELKNKPSCSSKYEAKNSSKELRHPKFESNQAKK